MMDRATGRSRGFGFITFDSEQAVEAVLSQGKMHEIAGKQASVILADPCLAASASHQILSGLLGSSFAG